MMRIEALRLAKSPTKDAKTSACSNRYFLYDLPREFDDEPETRQENFMGQMDTTLGLGHFYPTSRKNTHSYASLVTHRLSHSNCTTKNAEEADVFMIPVLTKDKFSKDWKKSCSKFKLDNFAQSLTHLTSETAGRHVILHNHGAWDQGCKGWWQNPSEELKGISRFTYEDRGITPLKATIPYSSQIHYTANGGEVPWKASHERKTLATFVGSLRGFGHTPESHGDRAQVIQSCSMHKDNCEMYESSSSKRTFDIDRVFSLYSGSEFCFQPPGDSFTRKGIVDSLLVGCIPVLFEPEQVAIWPWHWNSWRSTSMVFIHQNAHADPVAELLKIPLKKRDEMRASIAKNAHVMQYAKDQGPADQPDAFDIIAQHVRRGETQDDLMKLYDATQAKFINLLKRIDSKNTNFEKESEVSDLTDMPYIIGM